MDQQTFELMANYQQVITFLSEKVQELENRIAEQDKKTSELESMIFDDIIGPAKEALDTYDKDQRYDEFKSTYGDILGKYQDSFAPMEGEGFDLTRQAFDSYEDIPEDQRPDAGDYVNEVANIAEQKLSEIKAALGIPAEADVEIKETDDQVEVKADGETVEVEQKDEDGEVAEEEKIEESEPSEDDETVEDFEASLKKSL